MQKERGARVIAIIAICIAVAGLAIGYSALQTTLQITANTTLKASTWKIEWADYDDASAVTATGTGNPTGAVVADTNKQTLTMTTTLKNPGDKVEYTFSAANLGDIDAKIDTIAITGVVATTPAGTVADPWIATENSDVKYVLTYSDGSQIKQNDVLGKGTGSPIVATKKPMKLTVYYDSAATSVPSTDVTLKFTYKINYIQKN